MKNALTYSIAVLAASIATVRGFHEQEFDHELRAIVDDMSMFVVDNVFDFDANSSPKGLKHCVETVTSKVIDYTASCIHKYCKKATNEKGKSMCQAAKENPKFVTGSLLYKLKPAKVAAAYCAGKFDLKAPIKKNKALFNEDNIFGLLTYKEKFIYTVDQKHYNTQSLSELNSVHDCKSCVINTAVNGVEYLYEKMELICANNYAREDYNELVDFVCGLMAKDSEIARGVLFQKYQVMNWSGAFCLGSGACKKTGDRLIEYEGFFKAYAESKKHLSQEHQQKVEEPQAMQAQQQQQKVVHPVEQVYQQKRQIHKKQQKKVQRKD